MTTVLITAAMLSAAVALAHAFVMERRYRAAKRRRPADSAAPGTPTRPGVVHQVREDPWARQERIQAERWAEERRVVARAIAWLRRTWGTRPCPYCEATQWEVGSPLEVRLTDAHVMPLAPVLCGRCGHTTFVNSEFIPRSDKRP